MSKTLVQQGSVETLYHYYLLLLFIIIIKYFSGSVLPVVWNMTTSRQGTLRSPYLDVILVDNIKAV